MRQGGLTYQNYAAGRVKRYLAWAVLKMKATGKQFLFTNTHLDPYDIAARKQQWDEMIAKINSLKGSLPVVSVGDFNTSKFSDYADTYLPRMRSNGYGDVVNQKYRETLLSAAAGRERATRLGELVLRLEPQRGRLRLRGGHAATRSATASTGSSPATTSPSRAWEVVVNVRCNHSEAARCHPLRPRTGAGDTRPPLIHSTTVRRCTPRVHSAHCRPPVTAGRVGGTEEVSGVHALPGAGTAAAVVTTGGSGGPDTCTPRPDIRVFSRRPGPRAGTSPTRENS